VSLFLTAVVSLVNECLTNRFATATVPDYDDIDDKHNPIIIAGFGRVGQIGARLLAIVENNLLRWKLTPHKWM